MLIGSMPQKLGCALFARALSRNSLNRNESATLNSLGVTTGGGITLMVTSILSIKVAATTKNGLSVGVPIISDTRSVMRGFMYGMRGEVEIGGSGG